MKKLALFLTPLGLAWLLLTGWLVWAFWHRRRGLFWPALAWLVLSVGTCTPLASWLLADLESRFPRVLPMEVAVADAIICLGGGAEPSLREPTAVGFNSAADRVMTALALLGAERAPVMVVAGGDYRDQTRRYSEADAVVGWIQAAVKPRQEVLSLGICADTHDEALKVAALAQKRGWQRLILVTSAAHMSRAHATFAKAGLATQAVPCDYVSSYHRIGSVRWFHLPGYGSMHGFDVWLHELLGTLLYRLRGWM
jgi:uncharacterized SAM-binding protein YcdF (DUF218 family)